VSESSTSISEPSTRGIAARIGWVILIVATLFVCYFSHLGAVGFVGPDEPRYAWIARDMAETGDWVTPKLYGKPWFEKPPLYYWGAAICFKIFGVSETSARLPSAICALLATLALGWLAWRLYGSETAHWLLLLLPTTVGMIGFSHAAATDMPFSGMLTIAMVFAAVVLRLTPAHAGSAISAPANPSTPWLALVLFGFFLGLAVLAKGPAAIVLSGGAVFSWAVFTKRWRDAFRLLHPAAIAAFCLTALPWYILCARRNTDFFRIFIIEHNFKRFLTPEFQHIQPFWFYGPVLLVAFLPWTVLLLCSAISSAKAHWRSRSITECNWFFICWAGFCIAFFTISRSKLPGYVLPAIPVIGVLLARDLSRKLDQSFSTLRWVCFGVGLTFVVMGVVAGLESDKTPFITDIRPAPTVTQFYSAMVVAGLLVGTLTVLRRVRAALALASIALPIFLVLGTGDLWQLDEGVSARAMAITAMSEFPEELLQKATTYKLRRGLNFALDFYLQRELPEWQPPGGQRAIIFTSPNGSEELTKRGIACRQYIVAPAVELCADGIRETSLPGGRPSSGQPQ